MKMHNKFVYAKAGHVYKQRSTRTKCHESYDTLIL